MGCTTYGTEHRQNVLDVLSALAGKTGVHKDHNTHLSQEARTDSMTDVITLF